MFLLTAVEKSDM